MTSLALTRIRLTCASIRNASLQARWCLGRTVDACLSSSGNDGSPPQQRGMIGGPCRVRSPDWRQTVAGVGGPVVSPSFGRGMVRGGVGSRRPQRELSGARKEGAVGGVESPCLDTCEDDNELCRECGSFRLVGDDDLVWCQDCKEAA